MTKNIYDARGITLRRQEEAKPLCGEDFCDRCGDCLACYGDGACYDTGDEQGSHFWVVYDGEAETA